MTQAFISYARSDEEEARRLGAELEARGVNVPRLDRLVPPGESWAAQLQQAISESDVFFVLVSPESEKSQWLATETAIALSQSAQGRTRVVPVLLDRRARPTGLLQSIQGIELFDRERSSHQIDALIRSIEYEREHPRGPSSTPDLEVQLAQLKSARETLEKEMVVHESRRAVWSSTIASAVIVLAALAVSLAVTFRLLDFETDAIGRWTLPFGLGMFASLAASLIFTFLRRRLMRHGLHEEAE